MPPTVIRSRSRREQGTENDIWKQVQVAIKSTNWDEYWKRVDEGVAREVDAYADARARSREEFQHCVLR
ncbi:MAG: hypothetical protein WC003_02920 [Terrimicrobiaceae bacterium]